MVELEFEDGVPIPAMRRGKRYNFGDMQVGQSVFKTFEEGAKSLETAARAHAKRTGRRVISVREQGSRGAGLRIFRES